MIFYSEFSVGQTRHRSKLLLVNMDVQGIGIGNYEQRECYLKGKEESETIGCLVHMTHKRPKTVRSLEKSQSYSISFYNLIRTQITLTDSCHMC